MPRLFPLASLALAGAALAPCLPATSAAARQAGAVPIGRHAVRTVPAPDGWAVRSATYTPSGKVLLTYSQPGETDERVIKLATMNDDGSEFRPFFARRLPDRPKDNGVRQMVFPDNRRIFTGDFVIECARSLEQCTDPALLPVEFPAEVRDGPDITHRWSEIVVAPDNRHIAWTTLLAGTAAVFTGELRRDGAGYVIAAPRIVSTLEPFVRDPRYPDGVIPQPVRGGEVKQFVRGGAAISLAGAARRDLAGSVLQDLASGEIRPVTDSPGYTETTIFSPDERLGLTMTAQFSPASDLALLSLIPRPYAASLNMGLNMAAYFHSVTGVRSARPGNVGPALIDIRASMTQPGYRGINLSADTAWVFHSPMSWHPGGRKAMWIEGRRGTVERRVRVVELPDYRAGPAVRPAPTPDAMRHASSDLSALARLIERSRGIEAKVYGRKSGFITYRRTPGSIEKIYSGFSDDGRTTWSGRESFRPNPRGNSIYVADLIATGADPGRMDVTMTFGPLGGPLPAKLIFEPDPAGKPQTRGYAEYRGKRLTVDALVP